MNKTTKKNERRNKAVVYLMVFVLMAVAVASIITVNVANDDQDGNVSGAGYSPVESKEPTGTEILIGSIDDLMKIGVDPGYPLSGDYLQTADLDFTNLSSYNTSNLGWLLKIEVLSTAPNGSQYYNVTFKISYSTDDGLNYDPITGNVQYFFGQYNTGLVEITFDTTHDGTISVSGLTSRYTGDYGFYFAIGGTIDDPYVLDQTFAASIYVEDKDSRPSKESFQMGNFKSIGTYSDPFRGTYDGNGYSITGMETAHFFGDYTDWVTNTHRYQHSLGMFSDAFNANLVNIELNGGSVTNVMVLIRSNVTSATTAISYSGSIVGNMRDASFTLDNCFSSADVVTSSSGGGIAGRTGNTAADTPITNCTNAGRIFSQQGVLGGITGSGSGATDSINTGDIYGLSHSGGIVGWQYVGTVSGCVNTGRIMMTGSTVGGIVGNQLGQVYDSFNFGDVSGTLYVGGITGYYYGTQTQPQLIKGSSNHGKITGTASDVGGIIGDAKASPAGVENCLNTGDVSGTSRIAGIAGAGIRVTGSFNTGTISGSAASGVAAGIIGSITAGANPLVLECGNTGNINGAGYVSGVLGYVDAASANITVRDCYNQGALTTTSATAGYDFGGIVGTVAHGASLEIDHTYNSSIISSSRPVRGIIGTTTVSGTVTINESYYLYDPLSTNTGAPLAFNASTTPLALADFSDPSTYTSSTRWISGAPWNMNSQINDGMPYFGFMADITVGTTPREQIIFDGESYGTIETFVTGTGLPFVTYQWMTSPNGSTSWSAIPSGARVVSTLPALNTALMGDGTSPTAFFKCEVTPILKGVSATPIDSGVVTFKAFFGMTIDTDMAMSSGTAIEFNLGGSTPTWVSYPTLGERIMLKNPDDLTSADLSLKFTGAAGQDIIKWKETAGGTESPNDTWAFGGTYNENLRFVAVLGYQVTLTDYDYTTVNYEYTTGQTSSSGTYGSSTVLLVGLDDTLKLTATPDSYFYFRGWNDVSADDGVKTLTTAEVTAPISIKAQSAPLMTIPTPQADQELLDGTSADPLSATMPAISSFYSFQWKQSTDGSTWTNVLSAGTSDSYNPGTWQVSDGAMYFKCVVTSSITGEEISTSPVNIIAYYGLTGMSSDRTIAGTTLQYSVGGGWQDFTSTVLVKTNLSVRIDGLTTGQNGVIGWKDSTGTEYPGNNSEWNNLTLTENMTVDVFLGFYVTFINDGDGTVSSDKGDLPVLLGMDDELILTASNPGPGYKFITWSGTYGTDLTATVKGDEISAPLTVTGKFDLVLTVTGPASGDMFFKDTNNLTVTASTVSGETLVFKWYMNDGSGWVLIDTTDVPTISIVSTAVGDEWSYRCIVSTASGMVGEVTSDEAKITMYYELTVSQDIVGGRIYYTLDSDTELEYLGSRVMLKSLSGDATSTVTMRFDADGTGMGVKSWSPDQTVTVSGDVSIAMTMGYYITFSSLGNGDVTGSMGSPALVGRADTLTLTASNPAAGYMFSTWGARGNDLVITIDGSTLSAAETITGTFTQVLSFTTNPVGGDKFYNDTSTLTVVVNNLSGEMIILTWYRSYGGVDEVIGTGSSITIPSTDVGNGWTYWCVATTADGVIGALNSSVVTVTMYYELTVSQDIVGGRIYYTLDSDTELEYLGSRVMLKSLSGDATSTVTMRFDGAAVGMGVKSWSPDQTVTVSGDVSIAMTMGYYITFGDDGNGEVASNMGASPALVGLADTLILTATNPAAGYIFSTWSGLSGTYGTSTPISIPGSSFTGPDTITGTFTQVLTIGGDLDVTVKSVHMGDVQTLMFTVNNPSGLTISYQWYERVKDVGEWKPIGDGTNTLVVSTQNAGAIMQYMCIVSADDVGSLPSSIATIAMYYQLTISSDVAAGQIQYQFAGGEWTPYSGPILLMNAPGSTAVTHIAVRITGLPTGMGVALWSTGLYTSDSQIFDVVYVSSDVDILAKLGYAVEITVGENGNIEYSRDGGANYQNYISGEVIYIGVDEVSIKAVPDNGFKFSQWDGITDTADVVVLSNLTAPISFSASFQKLSELNGLVFAIVMLAILVIIGISAMVYSRTE